MSHAPALSNASISALLKERTADHHHRAERHPLQQAIAKGAVDRGDYAKWVVEQRSLQAALERLLDAGAIADPRVGQVFADHHRRLERFDADCRDLGTDPDRAASAPTAAFVADLERLARERPIALLGVLYVIEGSTNGGQYLAAALRRSASFTDGRGLSALDPHGSRTRELWQGFRSAIDGIPLDETDRESIIRAAAETFDAIGRMLDAVGAETQIR